MINDVKGIEYSESEGGVLEGFHICMWISSKEKIIEATFNGVVLVVILAEHAVLKVDIGDGLYRLFHDVHRNESWISRGWEWIAIVRDVDGGCDGEYQLSKGTLVW